MKFPMIRSFIAAVLSLASTALAQNVTLTTFGSSDFAVDEGSLSASYTQATSSLTFTAFDSGAASNYLAGLLNAGTVDWTIYTLSPYTNFALTMAVSGTNPNTSFSMDFYDSGFNIVASYGGVTTGLGGTPSLVNLSLDTIGTAAYNDIVGVGFTWDGSMGSPNTVTVSNLVAVVPEPSTYALLVLSGLALGGYAMRRRSRA